MKWYKSRAYKNVGFIAVIYLSDAIYVYVSILFPVPVTLRSSGTTRTLIAMKPWGSLSSHEATLNYFRRLILWDHWTINFCNIFSWSFSSHLFPVKLIRSLVENICRFQYVVQSGLALQKGLWASQPSLFSHFVETIIYFRYIIFVLLLADLKSLCMSTGLAQWKKALTCKLVFSGLNPHGTLVGSMRVRNPLSL